MYLQNDMVVRKWQTHQQLLMDYHITFRAALLPGNPKLAVIDGLVLIKPLLSDLLLIHEDVLYNL